MRKSTKKQLDKLPESLEGFHEYLKQIKADYMNILKINKNDKKQKERNSLQ